MNWLNLISSKRYGKSNEEYAATERRTEFQRDFDRLIFSAAFRRMQNKTQVFPLPGSVFVHNRLTHSLEVSSVGRSLGNDVSAELMQRHDSETREALQSMGAIVSAACLAHDLGNPPFGHSGESAIRTFFSENEGESLRPFFTPQEWQDVVKFDGNANTFRLLTHQFVGRRRGGFVMTYSTLASIVKYPFSSTLAPKSKFGFFADDQEAYLEIARSLGIPQVEEDAMGGVKFVRHPLVYLVEAADDICYEIMDIEDAHKLRILSFEETEDLLLSFFEGTAREQIRTTYSETVDKNDRVAFYRACVINVLERACVKLFTDNEETLLNGEFSGSLIDHLPEPLRSNYKHCAQLARKRIYQCKEVLDIDLAGYHIIYTLLKLMVHAVLHPEQAYSKLLLNQVSTQYPLTDGSEAQRIKAVLDYLTGMTDVFALDLYRKINGHSLPVI